MSSPIHPRPGDASAEIAAEQRRYFNRLAHVFDAPQPAEVMDRLGQIVDAAQVRPGETVLDIGTGAGVLLPLIQRYHPSRVIACDLAEQMLTRVHQKYPQVLAVQCDVVQLPLKPATADVVFMNAMYGNIADKPAACSNIARVLRPGGRLLISHPEGRDFIQQLRASGDLFIEPFPDENELHTLLGPLGFKLLVYRDEPKLYLMAARKS